jgi:hypothetical protein
MTLRVLSRSDECGPRVFRAPRWTQLECHRCQRRAREEIPEGQQQSSYAAEQSEQQALSRKLLNQTPARSAERRADSHLLAPRCGLHKRQIRQIDAGDQQRHSNYPQQHPQREAEVTHHFFMQRTERHAHLPPICDRILLSLPLGHRGQIRFGLLARDARL